MLVCACKDSFIQKNQVSDSPITTLENTHHYRTYLQKKRDVTNKKKEEFTISI